MQRRLIGHGKLSHISCMVWQLCIEPEFRFAKRRIIHTFQFVNKTFLSAHQANQPLYIMRNIPPVNPTIVFTISFTGSLPTPSCVIERFYKNAIAIFGMEELSSTVINSFIIKTPLQKIFVVFFFTQLLSNLGKTSFVIDSTQGDCYGLPLFLVIYLFYRFSFIVP